MITKYCLRTSTLFQKSIKSLIQPAYACTKRYVSFLEKPVEGKYLIDEYGINILQIGKGHDVMCLPGAYGSIWTDFANQITGFNLEKYALTVWDPPGCGESRPPDRVFDLDFLQLDAELAARVIQRLELRPCSLLGWNDGGATALILAAKYPELVHKVIVWGAQAYLTMFDLKTQEKIKDINNWPESRRKALVDMYGEEKLQLYTTLRFESLKRNTQFQKWDLYDGMLPFIECEVLILHGEKDDLIPRFHSEHLYKRIQLARLQFIEEGTHDLHIKLANQFNQIAQDYLLGQ